MEVCDDPPPKSALAPLLSTRRVPLHFQRMFRAAGLVAAAAAALVFWGPWHQSSTRRIVALGDIHGDYAHATEVLRAAGILYADDTWAGNDTIFVSTGDTVDRGDDTIRLYRLFQSLRNQSHAHGGDVINVLGNHEMMNAMLDWRYVTQGDIESFGSWEARRDAMSLHGWLGQEWMQHYNVTVNIPLLADDAMPYFPTHQASFVHGGIQPVFANMGITQMNGDGHSLLKKALGTTDGKLRVTQSEHALWSADGPFWFRGYALDDEAHACAMSHDAQQALGVYALVMGHTPHKQGIQMRCAPAAPLFIIDTGLSSAYGGTPDALEIVSRSERTWRSHCISTTFSGIRRDARRRVLHEMRMCR